MNYNIATASELLYPYKSILWYWFTVENWSIKQTRDLAAAEFPQLQTRTGTFPAVRTFERCFADWGFRKRSDAWFQHVHEQREYILATIWVYFYEWGLSDLEIQLFMHTKAQISLSVRQ